MKKNYPLVFGFITIFLRFRAINGPKKIMGHAPCKHAQISFRKSKAKSLKFKRKHFSFTEEISLKEQFSTVTDKYIFQLHFIDEKFTVSFVLMQGVQFVIV